MAVLHGMCRESVLCVDVKFAKTGCFITHFMSEGNFHQKEPNIEKVSVCFGPSFSMLRFPIKYIFKQENA